MSEILNNILFILYGFATLFILGMAILFPFAIGMSDTPTWIAWIIYPLSLIIAASQRQVLNYFDKIQKQETP